MFMLVLARVTLMSVNAVIGLDILIVDTHSLYGVVISFYGSVYWLIK